MSLVLEETRVEYRYVQKNGAVVVIHNVPAQYLIDSDGDVHETYSFGVAMRLEELTNRALEADSTPGTVHQLEF